MVRKACAEYAGVEVDTQGDAFFFAFSTAPAALAAASAMTNALASGPIRVRIGLHTGEPRVSDEGYVGKEVHLAARVAATGHGGQIVLSHATAELVEIELTDLGEHRLKDISEPVPIFQLGSESFPPLKTISNTNLPRPASSFVGREAELEAVLGRVEQGARLLTLTGPGGSGKTRLALEAATTLVPEYKAGVFWVGLASLRDPSLVTEQIAQTLGAKDGIAGHIGERELLLLLDNLEQVIEASPELSALLEECPNLTLLCTSRELLRVQGEVEYPVPPLAEPEAVSLFCERAQLDPSEEIAELCARLDNLPLAVELAAARTKALTPAQILERLAQRLDLLTGGRDADPRQQTLRATIAWSYDLLSQEEQRLFRALSVFAGGCTLEAAEEVADADLDTLQSLVEKSLLRFSDGRYWMLETIREYAGERLRAGEDPMLAVRHDVYFVDVSRAGIAAFKDAPREWTDRFEQERDNLRAALTRLLAQKRSEPSHELAIAYGVLSTYRGPFGEGRSWLEAALEQDAPASLRQRALRGASNLAERQGDLVAARSLATESLELARDLRDSEALGAALLSLGVIEGDANNSELSEQLHLEALSVFSAGGDQREVGQTLGMLGFLYLARGDYSAARDVCERALSQSREIGDERGVLVASANLGHALARTGDLERASELQREALLLAQEFFDVQGIGEILLDIAWLAVQREAYATAGALLGATQTLAESAGFALVPVEVEWFEEMLDVVRRELGAEGLERALAIGRRLGLDEVVSYGIEFIDSGT
jgi:predicted ATPase